MSETTTTTEPTIALTPSALFQLLLFGRTDDVRDSAAELLEPAARVPASQMQLLGADLSAVPRWEQVAARLAATAILRFPTSVERFLGLHPAQAARLAATERVFVHETPARDPSTLRMQGIFETYASRRVAFRLPATLDQTVEDLREPSGDMSAHHRRGIARWIVREGSFGVELSNPRDDFKGTRHWSPMRIYSPEGVLVKEMCAPRGSFWPLQQFEIDAGMLLRLEAGGLAGHVIEHSFEQPHSRSDRARHCVVSVECGASLAEPPVAITLVGDLLPRYPMDAIVGKPTLPMPLLGGRTIDSLDAIARRVGVRHGSHVRASFDRHPLCGTACQEAA